MSTDTWELMNEEMYDRRSRDFLELVQTARREKESAISTQAYVTALTHRATASNLLGRPDQGDPLFQIAVTAAVEGPYKSIRGSPAEKQKALLHSEVLIEMSESQLKLGRLIDARKSIELAFDTINGAAGPSLSDMLLRNRTTGALAVLIDICIAENDLESAKLFHNKQAELEKIPFDSTPGSVRWHLQQARIFESEGDAEAADSIYRRMLKHLRRTGDRLSRDMVETERKYGEFLFRHGQVAEAEMVVNCADHDEMTLRAYSSNLADTDVSDKAIFEWYTRSKQYVRKVVLLMILSLSLTAALAYLSQASSSYLMGATLLICIFMTPSIIFDFFRMRKFQFENLKNFVCHEIEYRVERYALFGAELVITKTPVEYLDLAELAVVCDYFFPQLLMKGTGRGRLYVQPGSQRAVLITAHSYVFCQLPKKVATKTGSNNLEAN